MALYASLSPNHRATTAEYKHYGYVNTGWDSLRRWDGRAASLSVAGITGPSQDLDSWQPAPTEASGSCNVGVHLVRFRYLDSKTGWVSNPSEVREVTVSSTKGKLTFPITGTPTPAKIPRSSDSKVDKIVLEMTVVGADGDTDDWFKAAEEFQGSGADTSIVVDISDAELETQFLSWDEDGHDPPPLARNLVAHRDRLWLFGQVTHAVGTANFTASSTDVNEGSTDPEWNTEALGASSGDSDIPWFIIKDGDLVAYEVDYYDSGNTKIVLKSAYGGSTSTNSSYTIFSRAEAIFVSRPNFPESFIPLKFLSTPAGKRTGEITAGIGYGTSMVFFTADAMFKVAWETDPLQDPILVPLSYTTGALNQHVVLEHEGTIYSMDHRGWHRWRGLSPELISRAIGPLVDLIDYSKADNFHAVYLPSQEAIRWFVVYSSDSGDYPKRYVQLDLKTGAWATGQYLQGISSSALCPKVGGGLDLVLGDENGYTWIAETGYADGLPEGYSRTTVAPGANTTIIPVNDNLPISGKGIDGVYAYIPSVDEYRLVSNNDLTYFQVGTAFSAAPASGTTVWLGPIPSKLRTKKFRAKFRKKKTKKVTLWIEFDPLSSARYLQVRVYEDHSSSAKTWASRDPGTHDDRVFPGADTDYPTTDWLVDLSASDGVVEVPIGPECKRYFDVELVLWEPDANLKILGLEFSGLEMDDDE